MRRACVAAAGCLVVLMGLPAASLAAVRVCQAPVSSGIATDAVEQRAKAKAISDWTAKARTTGSKSPSWRIAGGKILRCARVATGKFDCVALAQPCTISQVAPPVPRRGKEKDKAIAT